MWNGQLLGGLLTLLAVGMAVPGPSNSTCAAHASVYGRRSNIPLIIGLGVGFFSVNVICGLAVNSFEPESFVGKTLHYLGSFLMILLAVLLIFVARSKRTINIAETIPPTRIQDRLRDANCEYQTVDGHFFFDVILSRRI
ncbi:MAG: hypothetical protein ISP85_03935 [Candidatus Poseidonia sp.]|nr:hypothetical protein [Poseidonia sp.]